MDVRHKANAHQNGAGNSDGRFKITISDDGLSVFLLELTPPSNGAKPVVPEDILNELQKQKVVFGIMADKIAAAIASFHGAVADEESRCIARGEAPVHGEPGVLNWHVDKSQVQNGSCMVLPGELIVTCKPAKSGKAGKDVFGRTVAAVAGKSCISRAGSGLEKGTTEQGDEYRSTCYGRVQYMTGESGDMIFVDNRIVVSPDGMEARIDLVARTSGGKILECSDILAVLDAQGIKYGIDQKTIQEALEKVSNQPSAALLKDVVVARGLSPQEGKDARLIISHESSEAGLELENGKIDYHERNYPWNVTKDEKIGYLFEAKPAVDGIPVYGGKIEVTPPKGIDIKLVGLHRDEQGKLIADMDGALIINGYNLEVVDLLIIKGDVDKKTGNVRSNSPVHVKGYVQPGFTLESKKDIIVEQNVEDATVRSGGEVIIKGGIRGMKSELFSPGDVCVGFIEHASVFVNGNLQIKGSIINSTVASNGAITVGGRSSKNSAVVGGELTAHNSIEVHTLGSQAYLKTHIRAGLAQEDRREINNIDKEILARREEVIRLNQIEQHHKLHPKPGAADVIRKVLATRDVKQSEIAELEKKKEQVVKMIAEAGSGTVVVHKRVFPGVTITINNCSYEVKDELGGGTFLFDRETNKVVFHPGFSKR